MMDLIEDYAFACVRGDWADRRKLRDKIEAQLDEYDKAWYDQIDKLCTKNDSLKIQTLESAGNTNFYSLYSQAQDILIKVLSDKIKVLQQYVPTQENSL